MLSTIGETTRVARVASYDLIDAPPEPALDAIVAAAADGAGAPMSMISIVGADRQWFAAATGIDHRESPLSDSVCAHAIRGQTTFVVPDLSADDRFRDMTPVQAADGMRFYAGTPLVMNDGTCLGTLCVIDVAPRAGLDADEQAALEALARRAVASIELRRAIRNGQPGTHEALVADAAGHLAAARAALDLAGCTAVLPHLELVIAGLDGGCCSDG